jgi:hypothetical protein
LSACLAEGKPAKRKRHFIKKNRNWFCDEEVACLLRSEFFKYYLNLGPEVVTVLQLNYKNEGSVVFMEIISIKVIHPLCVLFKLYIKKHNLNIT